MKKIFLFTLICIAAIATRAQEVIVDPNAEVRTVTGSFSAIRVSGGIDLYLSQSTTEAVAVSASDEKFIKRMKATVENGVLKIYMEDEGGFLHITTKDRKLKAYVSFKDINKLDAVGAASIHVSGSIAVNTLHLTCTGASSFRGDVKVNDLELDLRGASSMKISGTAVNVNVESNGASDVKGIYLTTDMCTAKASGASDIEITVNKELNASASGASSIKYSGDGGIKDMHSSGASSISRKS